MGKIIDWFKTKLEGGITLYEGETSNGGTCSFKIRKLGDKTREIFEKIGNSDCVNELKRKVKRAEG